MLAPARLNAQAADAATENAAVSVAVTVTDGSGAALPGATARDSAGKPAGRSDGAGKMNVECSVPCQLRVSAPGFAEKDVRLTQDAVIQLEPSASTEQVTVTAYRSPLGSLESPATTRSLSQTALATTAAVTLDDQLRQLPGLELFRRSSSLVANPSSQGMSLRALGSTSASRTLITEDDVPLNDAFAGTIHWLEQPELAVKRIELVRGGVSDLYGSSAIGGVVNVVPVLPASNQAELRSSYGGEGTYDESLLLQAMRGHWGILAAGGTVGTDGYIQEALAQRGPVDIASNVHSQNGELLASRQSGPLRLFLHGSGFNEARNNGTPFQTNATRLWRYSTGGDWQGPHNGTLVARFYGSAEHFRQTFSGISNLPKFGDPNCAYRCGENPSKLSQTPNNDLGAVAHWSQPLGAGLLLVTGADTRDIRIWDQEQSLNGSAPIGRVSDHQRDTGAYAEAMAARKAWTLTASGRFDWFQNFDGLKTVWNGLIWSTLSTTQPAHGDQHFFDPRVGLSRKLGQHWALSVSGFRAFREPTANELYRATQVGNQLTQANGSLLTERATGWEAGLASQRPWGNVRASYFLTEVNRPVVAVLTCATCSPILLKRENLGQIESKGVALDFELAPRRWLALDGGYQYANATVTKGSQYPGNWIPEVARNLATMNVRAFRPALGTLSLQGRLSGRQFDDAANTALLHSYFRLDAYGSHDFGKRIQFFAAGENLFNRQIEDSKTPTTTLGMPRVARAGFLIRLGGAGR